MRQARKYFQILLISWMLSLICIFLLAFLFSSRGKGQYISSRQQIFQKLALSDYCLSTESRHTRHLSNPDLIAPFQDYPGYLDHFPSSSFFQLSPPQKQKLFAPQSYSE